MWLSAFTILDVDEHLEAARQLLLSVDQDVESSQGEIDAAWDETITHRVAEILNGSARLVDGRRAHERVHSSQQDQGRGLASGA